MISELCLVRYFFGPMTVGFVPTYSFRDCDSPPGVLSISLLNMAYFEPAILARHLVYMRGSASKIAFF